MIRFVGQLFVPYNFGGRPWFAPAVLGEMVASEVLSSREKSFEIGSPRCLRTNEMETAEIGSTGGMFENEIVEAERKEKEIAETGPFAELIVALAEAAYWYVLGESAVPATQIGWMEVRSS